TELLRQTHLSPQQLTWVTSIDGATHALFQIAQDIHQLQENREAPLSITPKPFNLYQILDQYVQQQSPLAQDRGQEFTLQYAPDAPQNLLGDPRRILQMTQTLFDYVLELSPEGAFQLELQDRSFSNDGRIRLSLLCPASAPLLAPDTPQEFDPISTLPKGETLALCRHLAESMGGQMGATRQPNGGCQLWFELQLPLSSPPLQKAPPVVKPTKTVLLVEDDTLTTKLVRNLLEKLHCEVDVANNGREAVQKSSRRIYDAILLDYNLPLMNGMEVTRLIRANEARAQLNPAPVIILTGEARLDNTEACYQAGATAHLLKPFEFDDLAMTLHQAIMRAPSLHTQPQPQG
ncbi:MAG: response regulator, partial [Myxococcota bacterium]|nr:response regulator [Myxococcota bacterium]